MTMRSIASTITAQGPWIGIAMLLPIAVVLLASMVLAEVAPLLPGLYDLACASCADPSNGISTAGAAAGTGAAGGAAGGAAAGGGTADDPSRSPNPRFSDPATNPRLPGREDDVGDATSPNQQLENARDGATGPPGGPMIKVSRQVQKWVESMTGTDIIGTVPAGGRM